jgi:S-adenosylmethionine:tRNA ribosyltransferase-isomerase
VQPARPIPPGLALPDYDYDLPPELIAQGRRPPGEVSRLLIVRRDSGGLETATFADLPGLLRPGDILVRNDTRVMPARLRARRRRPARDATRRTPEPVQDLPVELLLCHPLGGGTWEALAKPAKRLRAGDTLTFLDGTVASLRGSTPDGLRAVAFESEEASFACMQTCGEVPLPPYVHSPVGDPEEYQTSYAARPGAVAAPTAGFHFTAADFETLRSRGVEVVEVTLHVGPGTFLPIRCDDLRLHEMHRERLEVRREVLSRLLEARAAGRRIIALGTTSVRVLESLPSLVATPGDLSSWTNLFIKPGHEFRLVDALITNFHLPRTSLLVLVSTFAGRELIRKAYSLAVQQGFRFYSFGDGMVIL